MTWKYVYQCNTYKWSAPSYPSILNSASLENLKSLFSYIIVTSNMFLGFKYIFIIIHSHLFYHLRLPQGDILKVKIIYYRNFYMKCYDHGI